MALSTLIGKAKTVNYEKKIAGRKVYDKDTKHSFDIDEVRLNWQKPFPSHGQGSLVFNISRDAQFVLAIRDEIDKVMSDKWIGVAVQSGAACLLWGDNEKYEVLVSTTGTKVGLEPNRIISYWLSYDRDNLVVKYGKGYRMTETTILKMDFLVGLTPAQQEEKRKELDDIFNPTHPRYGEQYDSIVAAHSSSLLDIEGMVAFDYTPMMQNLSPVIFDSSKATLMVLDNAKYTLSASLPSSCQELYSNVFNCDLNWQESVDQVKLSDAIRYSIDTEGCLLFEKLKEKVGELSPDVNGTYLRITLGFSSGGSPGIPYVLEIWPKGHFSPVHNHGNAYAVIKVLFGGLTIRIYNKLTETQNADTDEDPDELLKFDVKKDDFTWIDPRWYQCHKLWNQTDDYCATIQCYKYARDDPYYWPYFDYLSDENQIDEFLPTSDFTFREMKDKVIEEYKNSLKPQPK